MAEQISLREANQHLSRYLLEVEQGKEIIITRRGKPVAKLVRIESRRELTPEQQQARQRTRERIRKGYDLGGAGFSRDEMHER